MKKIYLCSILVITLIAMFPAITEAKHHHFRGMHIKQQNINDLYKMQDNTTSKIIAQQLHPSAGKLKKIDKKYFKTIKKIAKSNLSSPLRNLLIKQAGEIRELAIKQAQEKTALCIKLSCQQMPFYCELHKNKTAKKIIKYMWKI